MAIPFGRTIALALLMSVALTKRVPHQRQDVVIELQADIR